jgi:hypothetical protein
MEVERFSLRKADILYKLRVMRAESPDRSVSSMLEELRSPAVRDRKNHSV